MEVAKVSPKPVRLFYFWTGIVATLAYRIIIVLNSFSAVWVQASWYVGTVGFILYFVHRYQISQRRARLILEHELAQKVERHAPLTPEDHRALEYILSTLKSTKEKWNYIVIFVASGVALVVGLYLDFIA